MSDSIGEYRKARCGTRPDAYYLAFILFIVLGTGIPVLCKSYIESTKISDGRVILEKTKGE